MVTWGTGGSEKGPGIFVFSGDLVAEAPLPGQPGGHSGLLSTIDGGKLSGKWFWELEIDPFIFGEPLDLAVGISQKGTADAFPLLSNLFPPNPLDLTPEANILYRSTNGRLIRGDIPYGPLFNLGSSVIGVKMNLDDLELSFIINGFSLPVANSSLIFGAEYFPFVAFVRGRVTANFGASIFDNPLPSGFLPLNGTDLSSPGQIVTTCPGGSIVVDGTEAICFPQRSIDETEVILQKNVSQLGSISINSINNGTGHLPVNSSEFTCRRAKNPNDIEIQEILDLEEKSSGRISG